MTRMRVDFNAIVRGGLVKGSASRADGPVRVGDRIDVVDMGDPEDVFAAEVVEYDPETGRTLVRVAWEPVAAHNRSSWLAYDGHDREGTKATVHSDVLVGATAVSVYFPRAKTWTRTTSPRIGAVAHSG